MNENKNGKCTIFNNRKNKMKYRKKKCLPFQFIGSYNLYGSDSSNNLSIK